MRTLQGYLLKEILWTLLLTVAVFTFVLLLGNVLKEVLGLLVNRQVSLKEVVVAIGLLVPYVLVFALPIGLLTATLLVFGRFSADQELTAARANGISLVALITPVLLLSVVLSGVSGLVTMGVAPSCRVAYKSLLFDVGIARAADYLPEKVFIKDFKNLIVYADEVNGKELKGVLLYKLDKDGELENYIRAARASLEVNKTNNALTVIFQDAWVMEIVKGKGGDRIMNFPGESELVDTNTMARAEEKVQLSDMTILQLWDELEDLERRVTLPVEGRGLSKEEFQERTREARKRRNEITLPVKMHIHRQFSFSFACLAFTLVGIPLGIRAHRRETTFGIFLAIILVVVYYGFFVLGDSLGKRAELHPYLILWLPNFVFQAVGMLLLRRADRGF